jgi:hypothetical protein
MQGMKRHCYGLLGFVVATVVGMVTTQLFEPQLPSVPPLGTKPAEIASSGPAIPQYIPYELAKLRLTVDTYHCDGGCPDYELQINGDGTVRFEGKRNTRLIGVRQYKIGEGRVRELVDEAYRIGFFSMKDQYTSREIGNGLVETIDHSIGYTLLVDTERDHKAVYSFYGSPERLVTFLNHVVAASGAKNWIEP